MSDLNSIFIFVQVVEAKSFAAAARRLGRPANSLSRQVQKLEEDLGVQLLQRSTRRLSLTDAGASLYARAADRLSEVLQCAQVLAADQQTPSGMVRVGVAGDFFEGLRAKWVGQFLDRHPGISVEFLLDDTTIDLIEHGIDFVFRGGNVSSGQLAAELIGDARMILVASPAYLAARGKPSDIDELAEHECLVLLSGHSRQVWRLQQAGKARNLEVSGRFGASRLRALLLAAEDGLGIAMVPRAFARDALVAGVLEQVLPECASREYGVYCVRRANTRLSGAALAVRAFLASALLEHGLIEPRKEN